MKDKLIFLHIAKAGGSTFKKILHNQYPSSKRFEIISRGRQTQQSTDKFKNLSAGNRNKIELLEGHLSYDIHNYFDSPAKYITMLRDPIKRVISGYTYASSNPRHFMYKMIKDDNLSFEGFLELPKVKEDYNRMVQRISGLEKITDSEEALEIAKENINNHFIAVGILERFDESLLLFKEKLDWKNYPTYIKTNVTVGKKKSIPESTIEYIKKVNSADLKLYEWASEKFEMELKSNLDFHQKEFAIFLTEQKRYSNSYRKYLAKGEQSIRGIYEKYSKLFS